MDLTAASQIPPKCGAPGGLNLHLTRSEANFVEMCRASLLLASNNFRNCASAPTKLVPQSLINSLHSPLHDVKRRNAAKKASAE